MGQGLELVRKEERHTYKNYEVDGYEIYYRRLPEPVRKAFTKKHTKFHRKHGKVTDWEAVADDSIEWMILGWKGIGDRIDGKFIERECIPDNINRLPGDTRADFIELSGIEKPDGEKEAEMEEDRKNFETTSDSNPSTTV